jgi:hypothetical protein
MPIHRRLFTAALVAGSARLRTAEAPEKAHELPIGSSKLLIYNEAGWELGQRNTAPMSLEDVRRNGVDKVAGTGVGIYQLNLLTGNVAAMHRSNILEPYCALLKEPYKTHMWRMRENIRALAALNTDFLDITIKRCREVGIEPHASFRVNDRHHTFKNPVTHSGVGAIYQLSEVRPKREIKYRHEYQFPDLRTPWIESHKEYWLPNGNLDFMHEEVRARKLASIREVVENYDIDGFDLDFTRHSPFFRDAEVERGAALLTAWVEEVRRIIETKGKRRGRAVKLSVRLEIIPELSRSAGVDIETWLRKGFVDILCLGVHGASDATPDRPADWYIRLAHKAGCLVCPALEGFFYWYGDADGAVRTMTVEEARAAAASYYFAGADGIQLYNFCAVDQPFDRRILNDLTNPERLAFQDKHYVFTMCPDPIWKRTSPCDSSFVMRNEESEAQFHLRLGDDFARARTLNQSPVGRLKLQIDALNRKDDFSLYLNGVSLRPRPEADNKFAWDSFSVDVVYFDVPGEAFKQGENVLQLKRQRAYSRYAGHTEVQACELEVTYPREIRTSRFA